MTGGKKSHVPGFGLPGWGQASKGEERIEESRGE